MFNLYQNQYLTKELIITKQLNQCKLAFWFCIRKGDEYIPISNPAFSSIIEESMLNRIEIETKYRIICFLFRKNDYSISSIGAYSSQPIVINLESICTISNRLL